jgi:uncharacterized membrane protein YdjX (TVP38/TMEM64 family)
MNANRNPSRTRMILWSAAGLLVLAAAGWTILGPGRELAVSFTRFLMDEDGARAWIRAHQPYAALYFLGLQTLQVVFSPIPGELSCLIGGMVFGWAGGFLLSSLGLTVGSAINVSLGRAFERVFLEKIIPGRILDRFEARSRQWGLTAVLVLFLFPGLPKDTFCYLFGLTRIPLLPFIAVSSLARMPGTLVLSLQGAQIIEGDWTFFIVVTTVGGALVIAGWLLRGRIFRRLGIVDRGEERLW